MSELCVPDPDPTHHRRQRDNPGAVIRGLAQWAAVADGCVLGSSVCPYYGSEGARASVQVGEYPRNIISSNDRCVHGDGRFTIRSTSLVERLDLKVEHPAAFVSTPNKRDRARDVITSAIKSGT